MNWHEQAREKGRLDALRLREEAPEMTGTELIYEESKIPNFDPLKDYSSWPIGGPVRDEDHVWILIQPHNAAFYSGRPSSLRALWGLAHTTDPDKAKPWVDAYGTSGAYKKDECYREEVHVYQCIVDETVYNYNAKPSDWKIVR